VALLFNEKKRKKNKVPEIWSCYFQWMSWELCGSMVPFFFFLMVSTHMILTIKEAQCSLIQKRWRRGREIHGRGHKKKKGGVRVGYIGCSKFIRAHTKIMLEVYKKNLIFIIIR
jgi:hypothetical protein